MQAHAGLFGAHRSAEKTLGLLRRVVYWEGMAGRSLGWPVFELSQRAETAGQAAYRACASQRAGVLAGSHV